MSEKPVKFRPFSTGITPDEYLALAHAMRKGVYRTWIHNTVSEFVADMESRGIPRQVVMVYFPILILGRGKIHELMHVEEGLLVHNIVYDGMEFQGASKLFEEAQDLGLVEMVDKTIKFTGGE